MFIFIGETVCPDDLKKGTLNKIIQVVLIERLLLAIHYVIISTFISNIY